MVLAYLLMTVKAGAERQVANRLMKNEEVENIHILFGEYDLIARVICKDNMDLQSFIIDKIRTISDIQATSTLIAADVTSETDKNEFVK